ncbi:MAG: carboxypeptidase regulatory-like domain-containing protein [Bryobacteraceae bacterium]|nr:carboxypeptidase regulatory-like domain-containing protein [Bryobacteraceae bacterium]
MSNRLLMAAVVGLLVFSGALTAQVTTGTILGTVTDPSGAPAAGAAVTITEVNRNTSVQRTTDETGSFIAPFLVPGSYRVSVELSGFKRAEQTGITLTVDQRARVDIALQVGSVSETIEVVAVAPLVQSSSAETGQVIEQRAVQELPLNGRNFAQLVYLAPGVTPGQAGENLSGASTFNPRAASNYNPLGQRANANGWLVDGIDNNEYTFNTVIVQPSLESVREFKVLTGSFSAEFGRGAGVVSVSTRSGTNDFHGTAFWFHRNIVFDARSFFQSPQVLPKKPPFRRHQMGAASSGAILKNRLFYFADYAGQRELRGLDYLNTVPTAAVRGGDFSNFTGSGGLIRIFDPFTTRTNPANPNQFLRDQFPNNVIPSARIGQVASNVASIYPMPNSPGQFGGNFLNFQSVANRVIDDNQYTTRLDYQASSKDSIFFRFAQQWYDLDAPQGQANCCLPTPAEAAQRFDLGPFVAGIQFTRLRTNGGAFNWSRVWSPSVVGEFRAGWARTNPSTVQSDFGTQAASSLGIRNVNLTDNSTGLPTMNIADFTGLSGGPGFLPARPKQTNYQIDYNIYWTRATHNLKFGYHVVRRDISPFTNQSTRGTLNFNRGFVQNPVSPGGTGTGFASLLLGLVQTGDRGFLLGTPGLRAWENAWFFQDDWKVSRRLTLNLGVRYEIYSPETEWYDRMTSFDLTTLMFAYANEGGYSRTLRNTDRNNFGPRFGFAYDMFGDQKTILRGGYALSYFPEPVSASNMLPQGVPHLFSEQFALGDNLVDYSAVPRIDQPFGPLLPLKPQTTAEINARRPAVRGYSFNNPTQYAQTWSMTVQRQIGADWMAELGYVGSRGINLLAARNHNEVAIGPGSVADRRPYQALRDIANITIFEPMNMSTYHGMTMRVQRQFTRGFSLLGVYTFGKSLDFGGSVASGGGSTGGPLTWTCMRCYRGPSGFDVKHRAVINGLYDLPWGRGRQFDIQNRFLDAVVGGWQVGGIVTGTTGRPFNVGLQNGVNNGAPSWPDRIADGRISGADRARWFDPSAFVAPPPNTSYGNAPRGVFYSPGILNFDTSVTKTFNITEKVKFNFRWEAFNLTNTPYFGFPNSAIGSPTVGQINGLVGDNRSMQFAGRVSF